MRGEHPFCERTSLDQIHGAYYFFIPMEVAFRRGAVGWRDVSATKECREAASSYCALLQFLAAMSQRVVEDHGGEMYTSTDSAGNMSAVQRFRVVCNLIVRKTHQEPGAHDKDVVDEDDDDDGCLPGSGHSHLLLPDYELLSPSNIVGVLWMIHVMDPQLSLIDVVREVVESSAPRRSAAYQQHQQRQLGDGDENENDDGDEEHERQPQPREDDADGSGVTTTSRVPHGQQPPRQQQQNTGGPDNTANKTKRPANQRKPRRTGFGGRSGRRTAERSEVFEEMVETDQRRSVPMMHNMYRKVNCLWKAIALLVDLTTGKPIISDNRLYVVATWFFSHRLDGKWMPV